MSSARRRRSDIRPLQILSVSVLLVGLWAVGGGCTGAGSNGGADGDVPAPSNLTATSDDSEISLRWDAVDGADAYNVYRSTSPTDDAQGEPLHVDISSSNHTDTTAENGTAYYYRVTAVDGGGAESPASGEVKKTPFSAPPSQP